MSIQPPFSVRRDYLSRLEQQYALPTKQFLKESYEEHPVATTVMVIFVASSFIPVVISVALAIFTICVGVSASLVTLLGLALCLAVLLLTTLFSSVVITLLAVGVLHLRNPSGAFKAHQNSTSDTPADTSDPTSTLSKSRFSWIKAILSATNSNTSTLRPLRSRGSRKIRLLALVLICDAISRIRLPRFVRYNPIYRTLFSASLFGPQRSSHFLQRALSSPFRILRNVVWAVLALGVNIVAVPFHLFGWKAALAIYIILFILSPLRVIAARYIVRTTSYLVSGVAPAAIFVLRSEPANKLRELSLEAFTASGKTLHTTLTAVVVSLRTELAILVASTAQATHSESETAPSVPAVQTQQEESTYEMVSSVAPDDGVVAAPANAVEMSTLRARRIQPGAGSEDE